MAEKSKMTREKFNFRNYLILITMQRKLSGIYGLRCRTTDKWYVGQSLNISGRWSKYRTLRCKSQPKLLNALRKYGFDNFDKIVLEECEPNVDILNLREVYWVKHYNSFEDGYNLTEGGKNSRLSPEQKMKLSASAKLRMQTTDFGIVIRSNLEKAFDAIRGKHRVIDVETRQKIQAASTGQMWINNGNHNRHIKSTEPIPLGYKKGRLVRSA